MIPCCQSLEEAISHVENPDVREELQYQYDKYRLGYEEVLAHELELESCVANYEDIQDEYDALEQRADQYESDAEAYQSLEEDLRTVSGKSIDGEQAVYILNALLGIVGMKSCRLLKDDEVEEASF